MSIEQNITNDIKAINPNLEKLKQAFPHCFDKNGDFDFEKFKSELSASEINIAKEGYGLDWLGKSYARVLASDAATTLLKEDTAHNTKPENANSQNLLIKGDNLEVLKHLSNAYYEKVKMIYIDPPYNTGSDGFVYNDDRKFTVKQLEELAGVSTDEAKRILEFTQSNSNSHSAWLTFMYPRLYIAKQLLKDDGVIFVSIDDNEVAQLRTLMDEVFGEENFVSEFVWQKGAGTQNDNKYVANSHEYILLYGKYKIKSYIYNLPPTKEMLKTYNLKDEYFIERGPYYLRNLNDFSIGDRPGLHYDIICPDGTILNGQEHRWRCDKDRFLWRVENNRIVFEQNGEKWSVYYKQYLNETKEEIIKDINGNILSYGKIPDSLLLKIASTGDGKKDLKTLLLNEYFSYPKPIQLIKHFLNIASKNSDIILDFFAGSGTTAHSVMQLNAEDGGNRKYILVQLPEPIDAKKSKATYDFVKDELGVAEPTIFEITKERIIRAANHIGDTSGFKIFETTPIWEDYDFKADKLANAEKLFDEDKLTNADVKALFTTWRTYDGIPLTEEIIEADLAGYTAYYTKQKLYLMHKGFGTETLKALLEMIDANAEFNPTAIIAFGYYFESKALREIAENIKTYNNKKNIDIDFITRY